MKEIALAVLITATLQACNFKSSGTWKNESISQKTKDQIKSLNDKLFNAIANKNIEIVKSLMSKTLLENGANDLNQFVDQAGSIIKAQNYRVLDEYNVHTTKGLRNTLLSGVSGDNDYQVNYQALNEEIYASLLLAGTLQNEILVIVIYGNYGGEWKINILQFGQYSIFNKNSIDYYKLARASYDKFYLVDAFNYIVLAKQCLRPANEFFSYQKESEVNEFCNKVMNETNARFKFPLTLDNIETKPKIIRIYPEMTDSDFSPMILYLSNVNLHDTSALRIENKEIKQEIGKIFMGIDKGKKFVFYRVFNEIPDGNKAVDHYGFVDKR